MPRPRKIEIPSGSQVPSGPSIWASGRLSSSPSSRPRNRPRTAATNSAVDISWTRLISHVAGTTVRYGSTAKPMTIQATVQAARKKPA